MTGAERGLLLLTCPLGEAVSVMTPTGYFRAAERMKQAARPDQPDRELTEADLRQLGFPAGQAEWISRLLSREQILDRYLERAARLDISVLTRLSPEYPVNLIYRLENQAPVALFCKGDRSLLQTPCVGLVGSRALLPEGRRFAEQVGRLAAEEGYTLVSGGAEGADRAAQEACLAAGGSVIVFTPGELIKCPARDRILYCAEEGIDLPFTAHRALARNRLIHGLGEKTFVAQCPEQRGGTWRGSVENLRNCRTPLFVHRDGSRGTEALIAMGGEPVTALTSLKDAEPAQTTMF